MEYVNYGDKSMIQKQEKWADKILEYLTVDRIIEGMVYLDKWSENDMQYLLTYIFTSDRESYMPWNSPEDVLEKLTDGEITGIDELFEYEDWMKILEEITEIKFYEYETYTTGMHSGCIEYKYHYDEYDYEYRYFDVIQKHVNEYARKRDEANKALEIQHEKEKLDSLLELFGDNNEIVLGNTDFNIVYDSNEEFQLTCNGTSDQIKINKDLAIELFAISKIKE